MRGEVLPWLEANVSVSAEQKQRMAADSRVPRFTVIFDREGYSPDLFRELQPQRIAALTYHRYPDGEDWRAEEFQEQAVKLVSGETVRMKCLSTILLATHCRSSECEIVSKYLDKSASTTSV
jgi:hypothetical protein